MKPREFIAEFELVERHLDNWAAWQRAGSISSLGYPRRAMVALGGGQSVEGVFEDMCSDCDRYAAEIMEALVHDLALHHRGVIYHRWLGCVIRVRNAEQALMDAYEILGRKITERGLA